MVFMKKIAEGGRVVLLMPRPFGAEIVLELDVKYKANC